MPCDSISTVETDLNKMDAQHVFRALDAMGLHPRRDEAGIYNHDRGQYNHITREATWRTSRMMGTGTPESWTTELKRAYSAEIVKSQAKRYGWTLRQSQTDKYAFTVAKR